MSPYSATAQDWSREAVLEMRRIAFILDKMYKLATTAPLLYMLMYFLYYIVPSVVVVSLEVVVSQDVVVSS